jgi:hypothetical protein
LAVVGALLVLRFGRRATTVLLAIAACACTATYVGAVSFDHVLAGQIRERVVPGDPSFVDGSGLKNVALVHTPFSDRGYATEELFWNRSVDRLLLMPGAVPPDAFAADALTIRGDGSMAVAGAVVRRPLLVDTFGATSRFRGMRQVGRTPLYRLLRPVGAPRLAFYMPGRYFDGWLALYGSAQLWPSETGGRLAGHLDFTLSLPKDADPVGITFRTPGASVRRIAVRAGKPVSVRLDVCTDGPWRADFKSSFTQGMIGTRFVSVRSTEPIFRPDPAACR